MRFNGKPTTDAGALTALVAADGTSGGFRKDSDSDARILFTLTAADFNATTDQQFTKVGSFTNYLATRMQVASSSGSTASAVGGVYTGASKSGAVLFAAATAYSGITGSGQGIGVGTASGAGCSPQSATPYFSLTTPHGSAATADIYIIGHPV